MREFLHTRLKDMTIGQSFIWTVLYMIFVTITMIAMMIVPQHAEEIWDTIEGWYDSLKARFCKGRDPIDEDIDLM